MMEEKKDGYVPEKYSRLIIIETDGNNVHLSRADTSGKIELVAILERVIDAMK
jgi:hypothetical protein